MQFYIIFLTISLQIQQCEGNNINVQLHIFFHVHLKHSYERWLIYLCFESTWSKMLFSWCDQSKYKTPIAFLNHSGFLIAFTNREIHHILQDSSLTSVWPEYCILLQIVFTEKVKYTIVTPARFHLQYQ